jgi:hypothetical protein
MFYKEKQLLFLRLSKNLRQPLFFYDTLIIHRVNFIHATCLLIYAPGASLSAGVPGSLLGANAEATEKVFILSS